MKSVSTVSMFVRRTIQKLQNVEENNSKITERFQQKDNSRNENFILFIIQFVLLDSFIQIYSNHFLLTSRLRKRYRT